MNKILAIVLIISILGNLAGLIILYKFLRVKKSIEYVKSNQRKTEKVLEDLIDIIDKTYDDRMVFIHHSVGKGILYEGGLIDSITQLGVIIKSATFGDEIGQNTDIIDWPEKFSVDMNKIIKFKVHPNKYYSDSKSNNIVMFKSCFPNSNIVADNMESGDPDGHEKTISNYKKHFELIKEEIRKHDEILFVYMTSPPLVPEVTTIANASRAREFNSWLINEFLPEYEARTGLKNLIIFDLFNVLADNDGFLKRDYQTGIPNDSHPNSYANKIVVKEFMAFFGNKWRGWKESPEFK